MTHRTDDGAAQEEHGATGAAATPLLFYGASGYALAMALVLRHDFAPALAARAIGFIDDEVGGRGAELGGAPVLSFEQARERVRDAPFVVGIGDPRARARLVDRVARAGGRFLRFFDDRPATLFPGVEIGEGCFVGPNTYLGPNTVIGAHAQVMSNCSIGHDVEVGAFCTICPSCTISGYVIIEEGVFLGAGTTVVNGTAAEPLRIGAGAKLWAGSVVLRDVAPGATLAGNPAASPRALVAADRAARTRRLPRHCGAGDDGRQEPLDAWEAGAARSGALAVPAIVPSSLAAERRLDDEEGADREDSDLEGIASSFAPSPRKQPGT